MRIRSLLASFALLSCLGCSPTATAPADTDKQAAVDALFTDYVAPGSPGAAVGVYRHGKLVLAKGYGLADVEAGTPITPQTRFHVASVSKQFTAFAIALLARDGKVDLDADIRNYLPYVPDFGHTITVRHLILHTSGLRDQWSLLGLGGQGTEGRVRQEQIVSMVSRQQALNFTPGSEYLYSNTGYTLLAEIVRAVSGKSLRAFTHERIFKPLGMSHTLFFDDVTEVVSGRANSYDKRDEDGKGKWKRELLNFDNVGATSLFTTVEDLSKWAANFTKPVVGDRALIEQVSTNGTLDDGTPIEYGFALIRTQLGGRHVITHSGSDAGFRALFVYYPDEDFAVSITANTPFDLKGKVAAIADLYLPPSPTLAPTAIAVNENADPKPLAGTWVAPNERALQLQVQDDGLYLARHTDKPLKLIMRVDGSFDTGTSRGKSFTPVTDATGRIIAIEQTDAASARTTRYERVEPVKPDAAQLAQYVGDYRSPELDITYTVALKDDQLSLHTLWDPAPVALYPITTDRFESMGWPLDNVVFGRDGNDRISHMQITSGRARHVQLDRVAGNPRKNP